MARKPAVFDQLNIVVHDMNATVDFYRSLGIEIPDTLPEWQAHHRTAERSQIEKQDQSGGGIDLDFDSTAFTPHWNAGWPAGKSGVVVGFRVETREDVDALYEELTAAGNPGQQSPFDSFWGARYAVLQDPSGNAVGLMSPVDPARRTAAPAPPPALPPALPQRTSRESNGRTPR